MLMPDVYLGISEAMPYLSLCGYKNADQIRYAIRKNLFRESFEYFDAAVPGSARSTYRINPAKVQARLLESPAKRSVHRRGRPPTKKMK